MLNDHGFDLWAGGYDKSVRLSEEENGYPFAGYHAVLDDIFRVVTEKPNRTLLDIGFGTGILTSKLYDHSCTVYGQDFLAKMLALAEEKCRTPISIKVIFRRDWPRRAAPPASIQLYHCNLCATSPFGRKKGLLTHRTAHTSEGRRQAAYRRYCL